MEIIHTESFPTNAPYQIFWKGVNPTKLSNPKNYGLKESSCIII